MERFYYTRDILREPFAIEFTLTDQKKRDMSMHDAYEYSDAVLSMQFEGIPTKVNYTEEQQQAVNLLQVETLLLPLTHKSRMLDNSKRLERFFYDLIGIKKKESHAGPI